MATGTYAPDPDLHIVDANGVPVPGGLIWTYIAGTLTPTPTYTDVGLLVPNTNPIVAGSDGRFVAFLAGGISYKFVYEMPAIPPAHGATIATRDNILAVTTIVPGTGGGVIQSVSLTGTVNDFALVPGCSLLICSNSSPLTFTGFSGGVDGQTLKIINLIDVVNLLSVNLGSLAGNRMLNFVQSGPTPLAPSASVCGGAATYVYSSGLQRWNLVTHEQGNWITPPFNAADYAAPWVVSAPQVAVCQYRLSGKTLQVQLTITGGATTGATGVLTRAIPGGYTVPISQPASITQNLNVATWTAGLGMVGTSGLNFYSAPGGIGWAAGAMNLQANLVGVVT